MRSRYASAPAPVVVTGGLRLGMMDGAGELPRGVGHDGRQGIAVAQMRVSPIIRPCDDHGIEKTVWTWNFQ